MKKYFWDKRTHCVKADVVGAVFEELEDSFGSVTAENFLNASRPEESPTHKLFEWEDHKAAENYRMHQARVIINDIRIEVVVDEKKMKLPAYVNVSRGDDVAKYQWTPRVFQVEETREIVLARARNELESFMVKYQKFEEFAGVIAAIREVI
jgi:hypothetical protein